MKIAFDVDDCLLVPAVALGLDRDTPNYEVIAIFRWLQSQGHEMVVWSGSGMEYAEMWADKLGLRPCMILTKRKSEDIDIAFDDCDVNLAKVNVRVKRINNKIDRRQWNSNKVGGM